MGVHILLDMCTVVCVCAFIASRKWVPHSETCYYAVSFVTTRPPHRFFLKTNDNEKQLLQCITTARM